MRRRRRLLTDRHYFSSSSYVHPLPPLNTVGGVNDSKDFRVLQVEPSEDELIQAYEAVERKCILSGEKEGEREEADRRRETVAGTKPTEAPFVYVNEGMVLCHEKRRGIGWRANRDMKRGELLLAEMPLAFVWDRCEAFEPGADDEDEDASCRRKQRQLQNQDVCRLLKIIGDSPVPSCLFPRTTDEVECLRRTFGPWSSSDAATDAALSDIGEREKWVVTLNCMSVSHLSDSLNSRGVFRHLDATALYKFGSLFNHSCRPSVSRHSIGLQMHYRLARPVNAGEPLCISYLEDELLFDASCAYVCLQKYKRLSCRCGLHSGGEGGGDKQSCSTPSSDVMVMSLVDEDVEAYLSCLPLLARVSMIKKLLLKLCRCLSASTSRASPSAKRGRRCTYTVAADAVSLCIALAVAYAQLGRIRRAYTIWRRLAAICRGKRAEDGTCQELLVCSHLHLALLAGRRRDCKACKAHLREALRQHSALFGGRGGLFLTRLHRDIQQKALFPDFARSLRGYSGSGPSSSTLARPAHQTLRESFSLLESSWEEEEDGNTGETPCVSETRNICLLNELRYFIRAGRKRPGAAYLKFARLYKWRTFRRIYR